MNGDIREPDPADDDIPVLTDIVVPGRLQSAMPDTGEAPDGPPGPPEFVFDIDFEPQSDHRAASNDVRPAVPIIAPEPEGVAAAPDGALADAPSGLYTDLPLPWAGTRPEPVRDASEPLIVAAFAKSAAARVEPPDPDAQALLRALLAEIGNGLEQRLHDELAQTEQRLRAAVREELDTRLRELLAGTPPTA